MRNFKPQEVIVAISASLWLGLSACDTGAVGVESCREIEYARCSAAVHCPSMFTIPSQAECRRYYRDHCLHGLPLAQDPGAAVVTPCVNAIEAIGECAGASKFTKETPPKIPPVSACADVNLFDPSSSTSYYGTLRASTTPVCDLIRAPDTIPECSFLNSANSTGGTSAGGASSTGGAGATGGLVATGGSAAATG